MVECSGTMDGNDVIRDMRELIYGGGGGSVESGGPHASGDMPPPPDNLVALQPPHTPTAPPAGVAKACMVTAAVTAAVTAMALGGVWMLVRRSQGGGCPAGGSSRTVGVMGRHAMTMSEEDTEPDPLFQPLQGRRALH